MSDYKDTPKGTPNTGKMQAQLKKKLLNSWDQMTQAFIE